ncbi:MAG: S9 family peptidase [Hyphomicrobiaceae bacterium]
MPPRAPARPQNSTHHDVTLTDDYAWLRAENWQEVMRQPETLDNEIRTYLEAENTYTKEQLSDTESLQEKLFEELKGRIKQDDQSVPTPHDAFAYFTRYVPGKQYVELCRQARNGGDLKVLLDGNKEAEGKTYWQLGGGAHSPDHKLIAYGVDDKGSEFFTIRFRDCDTGEDLPDTITEASGGCVWTNDSRTLFYIHLDENHRPLSVRRHVIGTPVADDVEIYQEQDTGFYIGLGKTQSEKYIAFDVHDHQTSEVHVIDADAPLSDPQMIAARREGHEYELEHHANRFIITTNSNGAEDQRICEVSIDDPDEKNWREILAHKPGRLILDTIVYANHLVRLEREDGLPRIVVQRLSDGQEHEVSFDEEAYSLGLSSGYEFDTTTIRFTYSSMTTPAEVYDYDMETRERVLRKRQEVPSGHDPANYITKRVLAPTADGQQVPVSLLHHKDTPIDSSAPLLLYGYGAYGIAIPASFATTRLSLVDRGFIYAIAHIRGGKDKGYHWYKSGKREGKTNTFKDFISAGEHLVETGYTTRGNIIGSGGSAGGMLMGAVANMAPDLFLGIIANVPFVDVLNTMLDDTLPLTPPEWPEWGNPIESSQDFKTILAYSPYENVSAQDYPHLLALAGLTDPRVTYWEPAKWIARLRALNTSDKLLLLKTNMGAGHGGASGRFEHLKEVALEHAFALKISGKADVVTSS